MEGLIPFVIRAIRRSRERSSYRRLSRAASAAVERSPLLPAPKEWKPQDRDRDRGRHLRARSEFPPPQSHSVCFGSGFLPAGRCLGPSRSLRGD